MALGALIAAYQEDDAGGLRALLPLAGRTLLEYQARCAAAAGAAPIVVMVERTPPALNEALDRLRREGIPVTPVGEADEAATRFEAGSLIMLMADGLAPAADLVLALAEAAEPVIATFPDDEAHAEFERIDAESRWAGVAVTSAQTLASTAVILGDWDLQSTLLRRAIQDGALTVPVAVGPGEPVLASEPADLANFERNLLAASRTVRDDWASRFVLPLVEELATERLMDSPIDPPVLIWAAILLSAGATVAFFAGHPGLGIALLLVSAPLDLIAKRLATLRLRPMPARMLAPRALWPAAGVALLALAWWSAGAGSGWGAMVSGLATLAFAQALRIEQGHDELPGQHWLFSRRNAILAAVPFAVAGTYGALLGALALYAAGSFFYVQHLRHGARSS